FAFATLYAGMAAAREKGLKEAFVTAWGDDGTECDPPSMHPAIQRFAEHADQPGIDENRLDENFAGATAAVCKAWIRARALAARRGQPATPDYGNLGKLLLWQDPLLAIYDPLIDPDAFAKPYGQLASELETAATITAASNRLRFPAK